MPTMQLTGRPLLLSEIAQVALGDVSAQVAPSAHAGILASRQVIEDIVAHGVVVYGVSTGFGKLSEMHIPAGELRQLQLNLVRSHACGIGRPLSIAEVRAMMLLRTNVLTLGFSGIRLEVIELLCELLNRGVHAVIPEKGSVGASGDLAPLAHLALCAIGEGEATWQGRPMASREALRLAGIEPIRLEAKEGLALLNGTQALTAVGALALWRAHRLAGLADVSGAMSLQALLGTPAAFDQRIHAVRPHAGQATSAARLRSLLESSDVDPARRKTPGRVQDAYSLRCMPQVHGDVRGVLAFARATVEIETGSATDNPLVFPGTGGPETGEVFSGGNFHGAPLALAFDSAAIAMTTLAGIAERRIDRLVNPDLNQGLPAFLAASPGISSGFLIAHVAAVSLLSESKVLAHPASVDNVPTSGGQEDHVSMGMTAATKLRGIVENGEYIAAIELLAASQALWYREPFESGPQIRRVLETIRSIAPPLAEDRPLSRDMEAVAAAIRQGKFDEWAIPELPVPVGVLK